MRFRHSTGETVHLAYCSNVHPAEDLDGVIAQLARYTLPLRRTLDADVLGVGLWIAAPVVAELQSSHGLGRLRAALDAAGAEVVTLNGFPYGGFHDPVVKTAVYRPDWSDPLRLRYTLELARILCALLPDDVDAGSISTLPLGWREGWSAKDSAATAALLRLSEGLADLQQETGRTIRVAFEPEPGCIVETSEQAVEALRDVAPQWLGVCLDACHLAVQFEDPAAAVERVGAAGLGLVKAQLSSALRAADPLQSRDRLGGFVEPRFLHQTRERVEAAPPLGVDDLDLALDGGLPGANEWRVHFHVPVHVDSVETTQLQLRDTIDALVGGGQPATRHLEVETYTWGVLPERQRPVDDEGLIRGLAAELSWVREQLIAAGLEERS